MEDYYGIKSRRAREYIRSLPFKKKIPMKSMFPKTSDLALDLLEKLLAFNPVKRITVEEALRHPYLEPYHVRTGCPILLASSKHMRASLWIFLLLPSLGCLDRTAIGILFVRGARLKT